MLPKSRRETPFVRLVGLRCFTGYTKFLIGTEQGVVKCVINVVNLNSTFLNLQAIMKKDAIECALSVAKNTQYCFFLFFLSYFYIFLVPQVIFLTHPHLSIPFIATFWRNTRHVCLIMLM